MTEWRTSMVADTVVGNRLSGYALRFGDVASLVEGGQRFDEVVQRGAFSASLAAGPPVVLFAHGRSALGQLPVGKVLDVHEDSVGLWIDVELYTGEMFAPVLDSVKSGGLRSLSIGFSVPDGGEMWNRNTRPPLRTLRAVDLSEISIVSRGAYKLAKAGLRKADRLAELLAEREQVLFRIERLERAETIRYEQRKARGREIGYQARQRKAQEIRDRRDR